MFPQNQCFQFILRWPLQGSRGQGIWTLNLGTWWTCDSRTGGNRSTAGTSFLLLHLSRDSVLLCLTHRPSLSKMTGKSFERIFLITQEMEWKTSALSVHSNVQELDYLWWECQLGEMFLDLVRLSVIPIHSDAAEKGSFWKSGDWDNSLVLPWAAAKEARVNFSGSQPFYTHNEGGKLHQSYLSQVILWRIKWYNRCERPQLLTSLWFSLEELAVPTPCHILIIDYHLCYRSQYFCLPSKTLKNKVKNDSGGTSLVVRWVRTHLPMQGTWVCSLVWDDPTCSRATKPVHNCWGRDIEHKSHNCWAHML